MKPSSLDETYWSHSLNDLQRLTGLRIQFEIVKALSFTESLASVASKVFGPANKTNTPSGPINKIDSFEGLRAVGRGWD